jgi:hypothetical protein
MSYRDTCGICGESYTEDNLITCRSCDREFCYRCGESGQAQCRWCRDRQRADQQVGSMGQRHEE